MRSLAGMPLLDPSSSAKSADDADKRTTRFNSLLEYQAKESQKVLRLEEKRRRAHEQRERLSAKIESKIRRLKKEMGEMQEEESARRERSKARRVS